MSISRREFFKNILGGAGLAMIGSLSGSTNLLASTGGMKKRWLGRTGLKVSEIGFGGYPVRDPDVIRYAIDKGINYFDTAWDYTGGVSEETIGKGVLGKRDQVVITTKWHPRSNTSVSGMMDMLHTSLKRLKTDYVDCLLVHEVGVASDGEGVKRLKNSALFGAMELARKQGKALHFGCSGHDGDLMDVMNYAIEIPEFSVILCRYNFLVYPTEPDLFARAKKNGVGVVAMKTLAGSRGAELSSFRDKFTTYKQAALKWVLSNPDITSLVISISSKDLVDEYVRASGSAMTEEEHVALLAYGSLFGNHVCRMCNECEKICDKDVKVADILRYRMYEKEYQMTGEGKNLYSKLSNNFQNACLNCHAPCLSACPYDIPIKDELREAHQILST